MSKWVAHLDVMADSDSLPSRAPTDDGHGHTSGLHHIERLVDWAEEDVRLAQRRVRETFHRVQGTEDEELEALALRLEEKLADEKKWRDTLIAQISRAEKSLEEERSARTQSMSALYSEVETSVVQLVSHIDRSIAKESQVVTTRSKASERAVLSLVARVEQGCARQITSSRELKPHVAPRPITPTSASENRIASMKPDEIGLGRSLSPSRVKKNSGVELTKSADIIDAWRELRVENIRLQRQQQQLVERHSQIVTGGRSSMHLPVGGSTSAGIAGVRTPIMSIREA